MRDQRLDTRRLTPGGRLLLAVAVVLAVSGEAPASALSPASPESFGGESKLPQPEGPRSIRSTSFSDADSFDAASHDAACRCGSKCRGPACCCGSRKPKPAPGPKARLAPKSPADLLADNPCLNSAPCRDPLPPTSAPSSSSGKVAALASMGYPPARVGRRMQVIPSSRPSSDRRASRLDRPPKAPASA